MKTTKMLAAMMIMLLFGTTLTVAQPNPRKSAGTGQVSDCGPGCCIPGLTVGQQEKLDSMHIFHMREMQQIKSLLEEKKAHMNTLMSADKVDMAAVNATIDDISAIKGNMMKSQVNHRMAVRNILDPKQKIWFDTHTGPGNKCGKGPRKGMGGPRNMGPCTGQGFQGKDCKVPMGCGNGPHGNTMKQDCNTPCPKGKK
jgi:Spy/CpxP family protein refolding chaperone